MNKDDKIGSFQELFDTINKRPLQVSSVFMSQETKDDLIDWNEFNQLDNIWKKDLEGQITKTIGDRQCWFLDGKRHREDGPAIKHSDGSETWYLNGRFIGFKKPDKWEELVKMMQVEMIMDQ